MRVTELMIDDWVNTPKGDMKVRSICLDGTVFCGLTATPSEWEKFTEYEISPIFLYWDTLMYNGFIDQSKPPIDSCLLRDSERNLTVELQSMGGESFDCTVRLEKMPTKNDNHGKSISVVRLSGIKYIHELQHILHITGIKIQINRSDSYASI